MHQESAWNVVKNRKLNQNENTLREQYSGKNSHNGPVETTNQYSILSDNDNDDEILMLSQSQLPKGGFPFSGKCRAIDFSRSLSFEMCSLICT